MTLSPTQFFHGTTADIEDAVKPGAAVGRSNYAYDNGALIHGRYDPRQHVHGADEATAWEYSGHTGRRRVYRLAPPDEGMEDPNDSEGRVWPHPVPVTDRIDIMHPRVYQGYGTPIYGVQGTLPPVDWNQFAPKNPGDANFKPIYKEATRTRTALEFEKERRNKMEENLTRLRQFRQTPGQQKLALR